MKVVVTGGAGFIGSHVVDAFLGKGFSVTILDNFSTGRVSNVEHVAKNIKIVECDISSRGDWEHEFKNAKYVIHLAALADIVPSIQRPTDYFAANVTGTLNVLNASRENGIEKLIYSASSSCYGIADRYPTPETATIKPEYPYALTKRLGEELVLHWDKVYGLPCISLRFFNVYGTRSRTSGTYGAVFGVFLAQKLAGKPFTVVGDGSQTRDFTYVTDIAKAVIQAAQSDVSGEVFNVGSGTHVSVNRIVELLGGDKVYIPKRPGEPDCTFADISQIKQKLSWLPSVNIEKGIEHIVENIEYWREATVWTPETIDDATRAWFEHLD